MSGAGLGREGAFLPWIDEFTFSGDGPPPLRSAFEKEAVGGSSDPNVGGLGRAKGALHFRLTPMTVQENGSVRLLA